MKKGKTMRDYFLLRQEKAQEVNSYGDVCISTGNYRENIVYVHYYQFTLSGKRLL